MDVFARGVRLFGTDDSVYVRIVRLVLEEKGVPYELVPVDVFASAGVSADYRMRHPFGRIPALSHDGFDLFETGAITRYIDEAFSGPSLQPGPLLARARLNQIVSILDSYAYIPMVWDVYVERIEVAARGGTPDEGKIADALEKAALCLKTLECLMGGADWLAGNQPSLADFHAAPMISCFVLTEEGREMLASHPRLSGWWARIQTRPSMVLTGVAAQH